MIRDMVKAINLFAKYQHFLIEQDIEIMTFNFLIRKKNSEKIHVNGCMDVIRGILFKHGMPTLLVCALVSLVVALIELLLLLCAACFADHIRKAAKHRSLLFSPNQVSSQENLIVSK